MAPKIIKEILRVKAVVFFTETAVCIPARLFTQPYSFRCTIRGTVPLLLSLGECNALPQFLSSSRNVHYVHQACLPCQPCQLLPCRHATSKPLPHLLYCQYYSYLKNPQYSANSDRNFISLQNVLHALDFFLVLCTVVSKCIFVSIQNLLHLCAQVNISILLQ